MSARGSRSSPPAGGVARSTVMTWKPFSADNARARPPWSNPRQNSGTTRNSVDSWPVMKPTSCSRSIGMIGFCTAPSRASAAMTTMVSSVVGSCQDTTVPAPIPLLANAAAVAHAASWNWRAVRLRPWSSASSRRLGSRRAASAINVQNVLSSDTIAILNQVRWTKSRVRDRHSQRAADRALVIQDHGRPVGHAVVAVVSKCGQPDVGPSGSRLSVKV